MSHKDEHQELPAAIQEALQHVNQPPPTPREEMWRNIQAQRAPHKVVRGPFGTSRWLRWSVAAAAVLALGFLLGRVWDKGTPHATREEPVARIPVADGDTDRVGAAPLSQAQLLHAASHFSRSSVLLAQFAESADKEEPLDPQLNTWANDLLINTRLLLDSPLAQDPQYRKLLRDLEFTLASIVQASAGEVESEDRKWVAGQVGESSLVERLRLVVPVFPGARDI